MMQLWMFLLLLHLHHGNSPRTQDGEEVGSLNVMCLFLPAPSSVSISSFNMQHILRFLPDPRTPPDTHFTAEIVRPRKNLWRPVSGCSELTAGQTCNLTRVFKDPYDHYRARVQAFTSYQTSNWTLSEWFQPLSNTVLGPPDVSVSGCGNCLIVQLKVSAWELQEGLQLKDLYRGVIFLVQRTRDGAQFTLNLPYNNKNVITHLQTGAEYCVTVSAKGAFNSITVPSKPHCAFTSPPSPKSSSTLVFSLLGVFCALGILFTGLVVYGALNLELIRQHLPRRLLNIFIHRRSACEYSGRFLAIQLHGSAKCLLTPRSPVQALKNGTHGEENNRALAAM